MAISSLTTTRIMGMMSGMDTESIVKQLMQIEQLKLNKQLRAQTTLQWRQDALKSVATDMKLFKNSFLTTLGADAMLSTGAYTSYNVALSGSKQDAISISATSEAALKKVTVNKIVQLASGATVSSSSGVSAAGKTELSEGNYVKLGDLEFANDLFVGTKTVKQPAKEQETITKNGETYKVFQSKTDSSQLYYQIEGESAFYTMTEDENGAVFTEAPDVSGDEVSEKMVYIQIPVVDTETGEFTRVSYTYTNDEGTWTDYYWKDVDGKLYHSADADTELTAEEMEEYTAKQGELKEVMTTKMEDVEVADDTIKFAINGVDFTFTKDTTLAQMLSAVNNSTAGVSMTYSRLTDGFSITSKETGSASKLVIENKQGNAFGTGGIYTDENGAEYTVSGSAFGIEEYGVKDEEGNLTSANDALGGKNSIIYIEGVRVERSSNSFSIDGIRYTLNHTTDETDNAVFNQEVAITANLTQNVDAAVEKIAKFVEGYNTMVNKLYGLVSEKKNSNYYALTDDEKAAMTEDQVKEWENLAKSGLLRNDRDIQNVLSQLRQAFYTAVEGTGLSAQDIGLRTAYGSRSGEITINETDLRAALEKDSDMVMRVFMQDSGSEAGKGLLYRLDDIIKDYTNTTQYNTLSSLDRDMNKLVNKIADMEERMITLEERYYAKYAAMETALAKLQSQTNWISSMLGTSS